MAAEDDTAQIRLTCYNPNVYEPSDDSFLLVDAIRDHGATAWRDSRPRCIVEIGCGSGYVICSVALLARRLGLRCQLLAVDHSAHAVAATAGTLRQHKVGGVELLQCDLLAALHSNLLGHVDVLLFNPPYVPTPDEEVARGGIASAWAGGHRGRRVIDRVLPQLRSWLAHGGELFMVTVSENDPQGIVRDMAQHGFTGSIIAQRQADEETLSIVHLRKGGQPPCAGSGVVGR